MGTKWRRYPPSPPAPLPPSPRSWFPASRRHSLPPISACWTCGFANATAQPQRSHFPYPQMILVGKHPRGHQVQPRTQRIAKVSPAHDRFTGSLIKMLKRSQYKRPTGFPSARHNSWGPAQVLPGAEAFCGITGSPRCWEPHFGGGRGRKKRVIPSPWSPRPRGHHVPH